MRKFAAALFSCLALLCAVTAALCRSIVSTAADGQLYYTGFAACADTQSMGVPASQYDAIAQALGSYFSGESDSPQVQILKGGVPADAFNEKELQHLSDVRALLQTLNTVGSVLLPAAAVLFCLSFLPWLRSRLSVRTFARCMLLGWAAAAVLLAAVGIWAAADFNSLFVLLHRLVFSNNLWLMDPQTDLIILLMPESFFVLLSAHLLQKLLKMLWPLGILLAVLLYLSFKPMKSGESK
jgi:integral membrane protein (TIGR01906 family)